ncbi:MAG: MFS transporter, partial [Bacillus sp. (in: firmicutes)]
QENFMGEIKEGIGFIFSSTFLRKIILIWGLLLIGVGISGSLIIVLIKDYMHLPSNTYGWISTAEGIGILLGSYLLIRKKNNIGHINLIKNGLFLIGFALLVISFNNNLPLLLVLYLAIGMGAASAPVGIRSLIQVNVPDVILGRVFLTVRFIVSTLRTLAIAIGSIFADFFDLRIIFFVAAIFILFASFISRSIFKGKTKSLSF